VALALVLGALGSACIDERSITPIPSGLEGFDVTAADTGESVLPGSTIVVRGTSFVTDDVATASVRFDGLCSGREVHVEGTPTVLSDTEIELAFDDALIAGIGEGRFEGDLSVVFLEVRTGRQVSAAVPVRFEVRRTLVPSVHEVVDGPAHWNDPIILHGGGFLTGAEGTTELVWSGTYTTEEGDVLEAAAVRSLATLAEARQRDRATSPLPTRFGSIQPGTFAGTITVVNRHASGEELGTAPVDVVFEVGLPEVFGSDPPTATIGQILHIRGAGFVGGEDGNEVTVIRLDGTFEPPGGDPIPLSGREFVPAFASGEELRYALLPRVSDDGRIVSLDFNANRGVFRGTARPVISQGTEEVVGEARSIEFALGGVHQAVWVRFLPGFSDSVRLFGLRAFESEVQRRVLEKLARVYEGIAVEFFAEEPVEYDPAARAILDIGGPDPNGEGLFGYDNTPGKDIGNVRLHDHVGGANAAGAEDGYGYGGVFIESFLYFSEHPPFTGSPPPSSPTPEPEFDRAFDPVRRREATAGDWPDGARAEEVERAIKTLSSLIGDTAAHEFGHSLGLAMPYGLPNQYHNPFDTPECLMDAGGDRPFGERAELDGFGYGKFCGDELLYLGDVLPVD